MTNRYLIHGPLAGLVLAAMLAGGTVFSMAEHDLPPLHRGNGLRIEISELTGQLHLSQAQQREVTAALLQRHDKVEALFARYPMRSRASLAPDLMAIHKQTSEAIDAYLTPQQRALR
jgi:hypothetical protein